MTDRSSNEIHSLQIVIIRVCSSSRDILFFIEVATFDLEVATFLSSEVAIFDSEVATFAPFEVATFASEVATFASEVATFKKSGFFGGRI